MYFSVESGMVDMARVERCIELLKEMTTDVTLIQQHSAMKWQDAINLTLTRSFLVAYAEQREAGVDHDTALKVLARLPDQCTS